jgi:hypothetical protein
VGPRICDQEADGGHGGVQLHHLIQGSLVVLIPVATVGIRDGRVAGRAAQDQALDKRARLVQILNWVGKGEEGVSGD